MCESNAWTSTYEKNFSTQFLKPQQLQPSRSITMKTPKLSGDSVMQSLDNSWSMPLAVGDKRCHDKRAPHHHQRARKLLPTLTYHELDPRVEVQVQIGQHRIRIKMNDEISARGQGQHPRQLAESRNLVSVRHLEFTVPCERERQKGVKSSSTTRA